MEIKDKPSYFWPGFWFLNSINFWYTFRLLILQVDFIVRLIFKWTTNLNMSKRAKTSSLKIKSSDGDEFDVDDDVMREMETLKSLTMLDDDEHVPICALTSSSLERVLLWTKFQNCFKNMDLRNTFEMIISADYLANDSLLEEMLKNVFCNNSRKVIDEAANKFGNNTITPILNNFKRKNEALVLLRKSKIDISYYVKSRREWIPIADIPSRFENGENMKLCTVKGNIYLLGNFSVVEYNPRIKSWRNLPRFQVADEINH